MSDGTGLIEPVRGFLSAPRCAVLSTLGPDGAPRQIVIHYMLGEDHVRLNGHRDRRWVANVRRDPRVALIVHDEARLPALRLDPRPGRARRREPRRPRRGDEHRPSATARTRPALPASRASASASIPSTSTNTTDPPRPGRPWASPADGGDGRSRCERRDPRRLEHTRTGHLGVGRSGRKRLGEQLTRR